jgi:uncharacterized protein involved in exopolysaccharide biosynthesis
MMVDPRSLPQSTGEPAPGLSIALFTRILLDRWRAITWIVLAGAAVGVVLGFTLPKYYRGLVVFLPSSESATGVRGTLAGLASQFGINMDLGSGGGSPRVYGQLAKSRTILARLLWTSMPAVAGRPSEPLIDWVQPAGKDSALRVDKARKKLSKEIAVETDIQTGVVQLSLDTRNPVIAAYAANKLVEYFDDFNVKQRRSQGTEREEFVAGRYAAAQDSLRSAEGRVAQFLERNNLYQTSPTLTQEYARLQRQVAVQQEVFLTLARELEEARIAAVNDVPVLTVIDPAVPPTRRERPRRVLLLVECVALALVVGISYAFLRENLSRHAAQGDPDVAALERRWRELRQRLRRRGVTGE